MRYNGISLRALSESIADVVCRKNGKLWRFGKAKFWNLSKLEKVGEDFCCRTVTKMECFSHFHQFVVSWCILPFLNHFCPSICRFVCMYVRMYFCLFFCTSDCQSVCLSVLSTNCEISIFSFTKTCVMFNENIISQLNK